MKKRKVLAVLLIILAIVVVLTTGCSKEDITPELKIGKYVKEDTEPGEWSWVILKENKEFVFSRGAALSYLPIGTYSIEGETLTLFVNEKESYIFTIDGDKLVFESGNLAERFVKKGEVFKLSDEE